MSCGCCIGFWLFDACFEVTNIHKMKELLRELNIMNTQRGLLLVTRNNSKEVEEKDGKKCETSCVATPLSGIFHVFSIVSYS